jgi:hypothetical protein
LAHSIQFQEVEQSIPFHLLHRKRRPSNCEPRIGFVLRNPARSPPNNTKSQKAEKSIPFAKQILPKLDINLSQPIHLDRRRRLCPPQIGFVLRNPGAHLSDARHNPEKHDDLSPGASPSAPKCQTESQKIEESIPLHLFHRERRPSILIPRHLHPSASSLSPNRVRFAKLGRAPVQRPAHSRKTRRSVTWRLTIRAQVPNRIPKN